MRTLIQGIWLSGEADPELDGITTYYRATEYPIDAPTDALPLMRGYVGDRRA